MKVYYENGKLQEETYYKNGIKDGLSKGYYEDEKLFADITYKDGNAVSGQCANGRKWNDKELSDWNSKRIVECDD